MASSKKKWKKMPSIKDTRGGGFGSYNEDLGGGTPVGQPWKGQNGRIGWANREKMGEVSSPDHREKQPRTKDGKFTYNSVNGKETIYESRGKTVNPLLTEGQNGIYIEDANKAIENEGNFNNGKRMSKETAEYIWNRYKNGEYYKKGNVLVMLGEDGKVHRRAAVNDMFNVARVSFNIKTGSFTYEDEMFKENLKGRPTREQSAAVTEAKKKRKDVFTKTGDKSNNQVMYVQPGTTPAQELSTGKSFVIHPSVFKRYRPRTSAYNSPRQQFNAAVTQLKGGTNNIPNTINPTTISNLSNIASKFGLNMKPKSMKPSSNASGAKTPKVSLAGYYNKK